MPAEFKFDIEQNFGTISTQTSSRGNTYAKEVNLISYNDSDPVYDIRTWTIMADGSRRMGKGVTLNREEMVELRRLLNEMEELNDE